jgi:hypothetical protein
MIYRPLSYSLSKTTAPLQAGVILSNDGVAMVGGFVNGVYGVKPAAGGDGANFAGFLDAQTSASPFLPTTLIKVETTILDVGASAAVPSVFTLAKTPIAEPLVYDETLGAVIAAADVTYSGTTLTVANNGGADHRGSSVSIYYSYAATVDEAKARVGDIQPGGYAGQATGNADLARSGTIYTDQIDAYVDWRSATSVKLAASGKLTNQTGSGTAIRAEIISIPTETRPFLGLRFACP